VSDLPIYSLEQVSVCHGRRMALDLPEFTVRSVESHCLVGPPGAGKSTLLRLLAGLESPTSGRVLLRGNRFDGFNASVALRRTVTLVFQRPLLLAGTVQSNVAYGLKLRGDPDRAAKAMAMLDRVHLAHLADRPATALSGGEAQLVALARALAFAPEVLLLDEPTNHLDPARVALVEDVVTADHKERGTTVVWATHNHFQARRVGDRVTLLLDGKAVETAPTTEFFDAPRDPRTSSFVQGKMVY
jgi:tungstate transport system ATP-binding protein